MAMQVIKVGGFISDEVAKVNANFTEIQADYAKQTDIPTVPTKTSDLTNDSGFITSAAIPTVPTKVSQLTNDSGYITSAAIENKVDRESGKGLSTEDYTTAEKNKLAGLKAPENLSFATANWVASNGHVTYTVAAAGKRPLAVMRKNGTTYGVALVDVAVSGSNIVLTSDEAFEGYIVCI